MIRHSLTPYALTSVCALACSAYAQGPQGLEPLFSQSSPASVTLDGQTLVLTPEHTRVHEHVDAVSVRGSVGESGTFIVARGLIGIEGTVWIDDRVYTIRARHDQPGPIQLVEFHHHDHACAGALVPHDAQPAPVPSENDNTSTRSRGGDDPLSTRLLIVYDELAENDVSDMTAFAAALVESANSSYANSDISTMRLELAGIHELENRPDGNSGIILRQLTNQYDITFDSAHAVRDALDADIVAHITELNDACGRGWLSPGNGGFAFSTTDVDCALGNLSFAHEVGHNQGCTHDPDNAGGAYVEYGYGHRWDSNRFRSVMAYSPGTRITHFSNPDVLRDGFPTGIANQRDNARVLDLTRNMMADLRLGDGTGLDCDLNALPDDYEIVLNPALDLDRNGELDACQILADPLLDCNNDGTLDDFQALPRVTQTLGSTDAFGDGVAPLFESGSPLPAASGEVTFTVNATGDLGSANEYLSLNFNGGAVTRDVFTGSASDCSSTGLRTTFTMSAEEFNAINDASISLLVSPTSEVNLGVCSYMHLSVMVDYRTTNIELDANGDGVIDTCACPADLNGDGELNFFDVADFITAFQSMNPVADFTGDGKFNFFDVTMFIAAFNAGCP
jgi:hypothetical protein